MTAGDSKRSPRDVWRTWLAGSARVFRRCPSLHWVLAERRRDAGEVAVRPAAASARVRAPPYLHLTSVSHRGSRFTMLMSSFNTLPMRLTMCMKCIVWIFFQVIIVMTVGRGMVGKGVAECEG